MTQVTLLKDFTKAIVSIEGEDIDVKELGDLPVVFPEPHLRHLIDKGLRQVVRIGSGCLPPPSGDLIFLWLRLVPGVEVGDLEAQGAGEGCLWLVWKQ